MNNNKFKKIIGIDLGTTNSVVSILEGLNPIIIPNIEGFNTTPSVVTYTLDGDIIIGTLAKRQIITNALNTFYSAKRFIGCKFNEIKNEIIKLPYSIIEDKYGNIKFITSDSKKQFSPEEISALVLKKLIYDTNLYLNDSITDAVITVPAYFNDSQRVATKDAASIAGINIKRIINEPTAAALAYGFVKRINEIILIFDFGGGTFDVSILEMGNDMIEVLSTSGDTHLGGDDIDQILAEFIINKFKKIENINLYNDKQALQRIIDASEKAKIELSDINIIKTEINLPYISIKNEEPKHIKFEISRLEFENLISPLIEKCKKPVLQAINDANLKINDINEIILVGGSTRIPLVRNLLINLFNKNLNYSVNPDEVVAMGAAIEASIIGGEISDIILLDVTPLSLGVEIQDETMIPIIKRNSRLPAQFSEKFSTGMDNQESVIINVLQGERLYAKDNKSLGMFTLDGIPKLPMGVPQIKINFNLNTEGILNITALEEKSGINQSIKIEGASNLNKEEINEIIKNAEKNILFDNNNKLFIVILSLIDQLIKKIEYILLNKKKNNLILYIKLLLNKIKFLFNTINLNQLFLLLNNFILIYSIILKNSF
jgi:chaperone protein DnaK